MKRPHFHLAENGVLVKCYHGTRTLLSDYSFWIGLTIGFPIEHFIWEKLWPFTILTKLLGL